MSSGLALPAAGRSSDENRLIRHIAASLYPTLNGTVRYHILEYRVLTGTMSRGKLYEDEIDIEAAMPG